MIHYEEYASVDGRSETACGLCLSPLYSTPEIDKVNCKNCLRTRVYRESVEYAGMLLHDGGLRLKEWGSKSGWLYRLVITGRGNVLIEKVRNTDLAWDPVTSKEEFDAALSELGFKIGCIDGR